MKKKLIAIARGKRYTSIVLVYHPHIVLAKH